VWLPASRLLFTMTLCHIYNSFVVVVVVVVAAADVALLFAVATTLVRSYK
jgi:hypothetical protein